MGRDSPIYTLGNQVFVILSSPKVEGQNFAVISFVLPDITTVKSLMLLPLSTKEFVMSENRHHYFFWKGPSYHTLTFNKDPYLTDYKGDMELK